MLQAGSTLGPYAILSPLGAGGMGEVYKARDTRLDRSVAIKILPAHLASNPSLRKRFEREAKVISALSHAHICTLHDVGEARVVGADSMETITYLVMEYLEGESLADRLAKGALPLEQALRYGIEIADALDKAHRHGVVHRDLKPGNIMLTKSGAKLLDFGLARLEEDDDIAGSRLSEAPTAQNPITEEGAILGTYQYMSPEQIEGRKAGPTSDIFALGAVLYEMVTGRRAFAGKTKSGVMAAIMTAEPRPISEAMPLTPPQLDRLIRMCLAKDPEDRIQTAHEVLFALKWILDDRSQPEARAERTIARRATAWTLAALALLAGAGAGALAMARFRRPPEAKDVRFSFNAAPNSIDSAVASPDGESILVRVKKSGTSGSSVLAIRQVRSHALRELPGTDGAWWPFWSPDSRSIGFFKGRKLWRMSLAGSMQAICDTDYGVGAAWLPDGTIVFASHFFEGLYRVSVQGGKPEPFTRLDQKRRENGHVHPRVVPGSDAIVFLGVTIASERNRIQMVSTKGGTATTLLEADALIGATKTHLYFARDSMLFRQQFDVRNRRVRGEPEQVAGDAFYDWNWGSVDASVDWSGHLLAWWPYRGYPITFRWFDRTGRPIGDLFTLPNANERTEHLRFSPDGRRVGYEKFQSDHGSTEIWNYDLVRGIETRVTTERGYEFNPFWTSDGQELIFSADYEGRIEVFITRADGSQSARKLVQAIDRNNTFSADLSPDGTNLFAVVQNPKTATDIWIVPLISDGKPYPFLNSSADETYPRPSPDGAWVAYNSDVSGRNEVYVQPLGRSGARMQISKDGGSMRAWSRKGDEIFYYSPDGHVMSVPLSSSGQALEPGTPRRLFAWPRDAVRGGFYGGLFEVGDDGQRFLIPVRDTEITDEIRVVAR